jgi:chain length determinant protein EpsF
MSFSQYIAILKARRKLALPVFLCLLALVIAYVAVAPRKYTGTASLVLDVRGSDPLGGGGSNLSVTSSSYIATQVDVLSSERVVKRAVALLNLQADPSMQAQWQKQTKGEIDFTAWFASSVGKDLKIEPSPESSVIKVSYSSPQPKMAADLANAVIRGYIETTLELRTEPAKEFNTFFDGRAKQARESLEQAQTKLSLYQQKNGLLATDEKLDVEATRLSSLSAQLVDAESAAALSEGRGGQVRAHADSLEENLQSGVVSGIKSELTQQKSKLSQLRSYLGDRHPQILELKANIEQLEARLASETSTVTTSVTSRQAQLQYRVTQLRESVAVQRKHMLDLKAKRDEAAVLERDVENARRAYDAVVAHLNKTSLESQTTQTNVNVLKTALTPSAPSSPNLPVALTLGVIVAMVAAIVTALTCEMLDRRLRTNEEVTDILRQNLLGVMPASEEGRQGSVSKDGSGVLPRRRRSLPELGTTI